MIVKIKKAYQSGTLKEKISRGIVNKLTDISQQSCRVGRKRIHNHCTKMVSGWYSNKEGQVKLLTKELVCDVAMFSEVLSYKQQNVIITLADSYLRRTFNLLGSGNRKLDPVDWHTDFKTGFRWEPGKFYKDYFQVDLTNDADVKIPWELSRCHHFLTLGQAYLITKNEKYTIEFLAQTTNWINENPFMRSINWASTMDVAIRAVNWIWALAFFHDSPLLEAELLEKILISLYEHGYFIWRNPEKTFENNHNHYISNLVGQIYLGVLFLDLPKAKRWLNNGISELFREMRLQILPSGPSYERSTNYHRLVLELFCSAILLLSKNNINIPLDIWYRLEKMFEFVMYYIKPDGTAPVIGDQDDGRLHPFSLQQNIDHRYLLAISSILFNRSDFKKYSNGYNADCFFLLGPDKKEIFDQLRDDDFELRSKSFPDAGFFILRNNNNYMIVNNSGKSRYNEKASGTHTHSDLLSFELFVEDKTFLVDPGSYIYSANPNKRKLFRSTKMHNTVVVDRHDQNVIKEEVLWDFERNAIPKLNEWESNKDYDFFDGEHSGYHRLEKPVTHRRTIFFDKKNTKWEIIDHLTGKETHLFECYFHFDIGIDFEVNGDKIKTICSEGANISLTFSSEQKYHIEKEDGWVSKAYGIKEAAKVLRLSLRGTCPLEFKTIIKKEM